MGLKPSTVLDTKVVHPYEFEMITKQMVGQEAGIFALNSELIERIQRHQPYLAV